MISFSNFITLSMWFGPWLIPKFITFFRSIRASNRQPGAIRPTPRRVQRSLNILYIFIVFSVLRTLPYFSPSNIFHETNSRLQIAPHLLFTRLSNLRVGELTAQDLSLQEKFQSGGPEIPYLYAAYGPDAVANCPFCDSKDANTYLAYVLPSILAPHMIHIFLLGIVTSSLVSGRNGARWRLYATIAGIFIALAEVVLVTQYDWKMNATKKMLKDVDFFYWKIRVWRLLAIAATDGLFSWALWLTSTHRWMIHPPSISEQLGGISFGLQTVQHKLTALGQLKNTTVRDDELRNTSMQYWHNEPRMMDEIEQEREVVDARRLALSRLDYDKLRADADIWVEKIWQALRPRNQSSPSSQGGHEKAE